MKIHTAGRKDIQAFFEKSGIFDGIPLTHNPFLVFRNKEEYIQVEFISTPATLLDYPDETCVMGQWSGEWSSEWFQFTVREYREFCEKTFNPLDHVTKAIKYVGPRGGFKWLSYEYTNENGAHFSCSSGFRDEALRIENYLKQRGVPVIEMPEPKYSEDWKDERLSLLGMR